MYTKRIQLINYGPVERFDITCPFDGDKPKPLVLVGENGSGKSIVLSHIVNGLLFAQQMAYPETPEVSEGKVYKFRSPLYIRSRKEFSFAQVEFEENIRIAELQLAKRRRDYANAPSDIQKTDAQRLWTQMEPEATSTFWPNFGPEPIKKLFERNCILYFPPNRFEDPAWLNEENLKAKARHISPKHMEGATERAVINYSPLHDNENWLFDVAYDFSVFEQRTQRVAVPLEGPNKSKLTVPLPIFVGFSGRAKTLYDVAVQVVQTIIQGPNVRFGIGPRNHRVISVRVNNQPSVPNVFQLSSGEVSLLNIFLSILRDFDSCQIPFTKSEDVRGVVVVDEIDMHLHGVYQYQVLPKLIQMFPKVQFLLTTHSPLFVLGLRNVLGDDGFGLCQLPHGQKIAPEEFSEFGDAYRMFKQTNAFRSEIEAATRTAEGPLIFVDGKTDVRYLDRAIELLGLRKTFAEVEIRGAGGDRNLKSAWKTLTTMPVMNRTVVLLHDCESSASPDDRGNVFRRKVPLVEDHQIRRGIENLFSKKTLKRAMVHKPAFIDVTAKHQVIERGHSIVVPEQWKVNEDEKGNLCDWLCENGTKEDFRCFSEILDELREIPDMLKSIAGDE